MNFSKAQFVFNGTEPAGSSHEFQSLPIMLIGVVMTVTAGIGNFTLLLTIYKNPHRNLRSPSTSLVINMAIADFMLGVFAGSLLTAHDAVLFIDKSKHTDRVHTLLTVVIFTGVMTITVGCCNVVAMACDRWVAVRWALNYRHVVTVRRIKVSIILFWIYAALFTSLVFVPTVPYVVFEMLFCHLHVSLPLLVLPVVYWKTFSALEAHMRRMKDLEHGSERTNQKTAQRERNTTKAFVLVLCLFYVAFLPYVIAINLSNFCLDCASSEAIETFLQISLRFVLLNSSLDPFVYAWRIPKYRRAVRTILSRYCGFRRRGNNSVGSTDITGTTLHETLGKDITNNATLQISSAIF